MAGTGTTISRTDRAALNDRRIGTRTLAPSAVRQACRSLLGVDPEELAGAVALANAGDAVVARPGLWDPSCSPGAVVEHVAVPDTEPGGPP